MPTELLEAISRNVPLLDDLDLKSLLVLKEYAAQAGDLVKILDNYTQSFVKNYKKYGKTAIEKCLKYQDELFELGATYGDDCIDLIMRYDDEVVEGIRKYKDTFMNRYRDEGDAFVEEYLEKADEVFESGIYSIDSKALTHSSVGDFTYDPKTGAVSKMKGGGHGQANIDFLEANGMEYNIVHVYGNGVRIGNVPDHKVKAKRTGTNQSWFPANWSETDIANAGNYVGNLSGNVNVADGVAVFGEYNGVRVGVIRTNGKISTIFPDATSQP